MADTDRPSRPAPFPPINVPSGGLKLAPFPPRQFNHLVMTEPPVVYMDEKQAQEIRDAIFALLDDFQSCVASTPYACMYLAAYSNPPFTIQRVCELCIEPRKQYKAIGKYLRAVEKTLLVTSSWDSFPPLQEQDRQANASAPITTVSGSSSVPSTPLFSPIPFLHNDARRSSSRSPPPSPLLLGAAVGPATAIPSQSLETKALGLVDELDDPGPGHLSEHPTAISSTTTVGESSTARPLSDTTLEGRFVRASAPEPEQDDDAMAVDEDKENTRI